MAGAAPVILALTESDAEQWVVHTLQVQAGASLLLKEVDDAETAQRGLLLGSQAPFLQPLQQAESAITATFAELQQSTTDNASQQRRLVELKPLIESKLDLIRTSISLLQQGRSDEAAPTAVMASSRSKPVMEEIRGKIDAFTREEAELLKQREAAAARLVLPWWR